MSGNRPWSDLAIAGVFDADVPIARLTHGRPSATARPSAIARPSASSGPPILAVIVGCPDGRWKRELTGQSDEHVALQSAMCVAMGRESLAAEPDNAFPQVIGIAELTSWSCPTSASHQFGVMRNALHRTYKRCKTVTCLEHAFLKVARLVEPRAATNYRESANSGHAASVMISDMSDSVFEVSYLDGHGAIHRRRVHGLPEVLQAFNRVGHDLRYHIWPMWTPLATAIACRAWLVDATAIVPRQKLESWTPPIQPPWALRRQWLTTSQATEFPRPPQSEVALSRHTGVVKYGYSVRHLINAVRSSQHLRALSKLRASTLAQTRYMHPDNHEAVTATLAKRKHMDPEKSTLRRSRIKLDVASMLAHRSLTRSQPVMFRYLACDASPQKRQGHEVFVTVERVVYGQMFHGRTLADIQTSGQGPVLRRLPMSCLGQGRAGLVDKVFAQIHQTWLEYGPGHDNVTTACWSVRQVLTDMGVEFGIADAPNLVPAYFGQDLPDNAVGKLYPNALQVPGMRHIIDWIISDTLSSLDFWPAFESASKKIVQYFTARDIVT